MEFERGVGEENAMATQKKRWDCVKYATRTDILLRIMRIIGAVG